MTGLLHKIASGAGGTVRITGQIAAWTGLALVILVALNVLFRYFFSFGSVALQEGEWHLMAVGALFGMSYGLNQGGEVRVDIFYAQMPRGMQAFIDLVSNLALGTIAVIVGWLSLSYVQSSYAISEGSPDPGGLPYRYILKAAIPAAFALLALQAVAMTAESLARLIARITRRKGAI
ncbi:MAG: TRAP transporter small permease subunit [Paracoccaceae bacterium]